MASYDKFKEFEGRKYTGMKIGRGHKWYYDQGEWKEKKVTPDLWEIDYRVTKRRAGRAPEGSGVPVGTAYHWYILAHQNVKKLNANDYSTELTGLKYKVAHRRAGKDDWNVTDKTQRRRMVRFLKSVIEELERQDEAEKVAKAKKLKKKATRAKKKPVAKRARTRRTKKKKAAAKKKA